MGHGEELSFGYYRIASNHMEWRCTNSAAVVMTQYIVEIVILPTVIFLAKTPHLFLEQISQPIDKRLK